MTKTQPLINFYISLRDDDSFIPRFLDLKDRIQGHADRTLEAFESAKSDYRTNGISYLLLRRFAVRQVVRESRKNVASVSFDYLSDPNMLRPFTRGRMEAWRRVLRDVKITNADYSEVLAAPADRVCFFFLDPPYHLNQFKGSGEELYEHAFTQADHRFSTRYSRFAQSRYSSVPHDPMQFRNVSCIVWNLRSLLHLRQGSSVWYDEEPTTPIR